MWTSWTERWGSAWKSYVKFLYCYFWFFSFYDPRKYSIYFIRIKFIVISYDTILFSMDYYIYSKSLCKVSYLPFNYRFRFLKDYYSFDILYELGHLLVWNGVAHGHLEDLYRESLRSYHVNYITI